MFARLEVSFNKMSTSSFFNQFKSCPQSMRMLRTMRPTGRFFAKKTRKPKKFTLKTLKQVRAVAGADGAGTYCYEEFNALLECMSSGGTDCAMEMTAFDACTATAQRPRRGSLLYHLSRVINSGQISSSHQRK